MTLIDQIARLIAGMPGIPARNPGYDLLENLCDITQAVAGSNSSNDRYGLRSSFDLNLLQPLTLDQLREQHALFGVNPNPVDFEAILSRLPSSQMGGDFI
jgi:hypothetical protein